MRRALVALVVCLAVLPSRAAAPPEGRWEGLVQIPGNELQLIVDLAQGSGGAWVGSIVIPGLGIKGAALSNVVATDAEVSFDIGRTLASPTHGAAGFRARLTAPGRMTGELRQAGNVAKFSLAKVGPAEVESPPRSTSVGRDVEDRWTGQFELGGYPRQVTLALENRADGASAKFVIVGKMTNDIPIDLVIQQGDSLRIESGATGITFEGRVVGAANEIRGTIEMGAIELPLVLRRARRAP